MTKMGFFLISKKKLNPEKQDKEENWLEKAGPREKIYFNPAKSHAGIVTCGGLCPGINDVIRAIVMCLWYRYGIKNITGFRNGYREMIEDFGLPIKPQETKLIPKALCGVM